MSKSIPASVLQEDEEIYPRLEVDPLHVSNLVEALRAGAKLPPVLVDQDTLTLIDGYHRVRAYKELWGENAQVPVQFKRYSSRAEMIRDAVEANVTHGLRLQAQDAIRSAWLLSKHGYDNAQISVIMRVTERKVERLIARVAYKPGTFTPLDLMPGETAIPKSSVSVSDIVPTKRPTLHLSGKQLTEYQVDVHDRLVGGTNFTQMVRNLREAIDAELMPTHSKQLLQELELLRDAITRFLQNQEAILA